MLRWSVVVSTLLLSAATLPASGAKTANAPHVEVEHTGLTEPQAAAIANTLSAARKVYVDRYGFDMPETLHATVTVGPNESTRLYTDGHDRVVLSVQSAAKLNAPAKSGTFNLYGMCHEVGHIAMYRILKDRDWMTEAAAEGWAHFAGSVVVDEVYPAQGNKLWVHDPYDYRADGTRRLAAQLSNSKDPGDVAKAAGRRWQALEGIVGPKRMRKLFEAWQASPPPAGERAAAAESLGATLLKTFPDEAAKLEPWWKESVALFVEDRSASGFAKVEAKLKDLENRPVTIKHDDDQPDGKKSIAGGGHARRFEVPAGGSDWYLRAVSVHGARYGAKQSADDFEITLCDDHMRPIATWRKPYTAFAYGTAGWATLDVTPTRTPRTFYVCLNFRPTATKGVFVSLDTSTAGSSQTATAGEMGNALAAGDWMIRVELDRPKDADALGGK